MAASDQANCRQHRWRSHQRRADAAPPEVVMHRHADVANLAAASLYWKMSAEPTIRPPSTATMPVRSSGGFSIIFRNSFAVNGFCLDAGRIFVVAASCGALTPCRCRGGCSLSSSDHCDPEPLSLARLNPAAHWRYHITTLHNRSSKASFLEERRKVA